MFKVGAFSGIAPNSFLGPENGPGVRILKKHPRGGCGRFPQNQALTFRACGGFTAGRDESLRVIGQSSLALHVLPAPELKGASSSCRLHATLRHPLLDAPMRFPRHSDRWIVRINSSRCRQALLLVITIWMSSVKGKPSENCVKEFLPFLFSYFWCLTCHVW